MKPRRVLPLGIDNAIDRILLIKHFSYSVFLNDPLAHFNSFKTA